MVVIIPTYDERENLEPITGRVRAAVPDADILVVDDNSPDGTGDLAEKLAAADQHIHVLHRGGKSGLGPAYMAGFRWALDRGYEIITQMDADGSHPPERLPAMVDGLADADVVLGSRWVRGGKVVNWPKTREVISRAGNTYVRLMLGLGIRDATGGFRVYRTSAVEKIDMDDIKSTGYCFQIDLAVRTTHAGLQLAEIPITFVERTRGESKMSNAIIREAFWRVTQWGIASRLESIRTAVRQSRR
jgi:dolichol-phosphate mannosyltransferase